jgi:hypothetical protein
MSIESIEHCEPQQRMARTERARARCSWLLSFASLCVACGGHAAVENSLDVGASSSAGASSVSGANWCEIQAILQLKCQRCHQLPPQHGAPFSRLTLRRYTSARQQGQRALRANGERCRQRVHAAAIPQAGSARRAADGGRASDAARLVLTRRTTDRKRDVLG